MSQELAQGTNMNIQKLFDEKQKEIGEMAKELAEKEFEIFELNLFVSSMAKQQLDTASRDVQEIRALAEQRKINLGEYEELADSF